MLSQARPVYLDDLLKYRRALKQRNALLMTMRKTSSSQPGALTAWTDQLVTLGARIIERRRDFVQTFGRYLAEAYTRLEAVGEEPTMEYDTVDKVPEDAPRETIETLFRARLDRNARRERQLGRTMAGPHRDELVLRLNGFEVRPYASQGQHRTFGIALKLAKYFFIADRLETKPVLLLDDIFGTLDTARVRVVLDLLSSETVGQSLITAARAEGFDGLIDFESPNHRAVSIVNGTVAAPHPA